MKTRHSLVAVIFAAGVATACGHQYAETGATTTTAGRTSEPVNQRAVDDIASARCEREARCDNVGPDKHYVSREGCVTQLRGEAMNDLTPSACPRGIDSAQLDKCLAEIRGQRCSNLLDTLSRLTNCRRAALCR